MSLTEMWPLWLAIFLMGASKGGFPVGPLALQMVVLLWPAQTEQARSAIGFMLPLLCVMDVFAVIAYRKHIEWKSVVPVMPWAALGVAVATPVFLAKGSAITVSDGFIKLCIGFIGLGFVSYQALRKLIIRKMEETRPDSMLVKAGVGVASGVVSLVAHAAGPIMQIYLLPKRQKKEVYVASMAVFFFFLNFIKLVPFIWTGTIQPEMWKVMLVCLPFIPVGVAAGYWLVRIIPQKWYVLLIYGLLFLTSLRMIAKELFS